MDTPRELSRTQRTRLWKWGRRAGFSLGVVAVLTTTMILIGCIRPAVATPSFDLSRPEVAELVRQMRDDPRPLVRPVVVLSGWRAWPHAIASVERHVRRSTSGDRDDFLKVSYMFSGDIDKIVDDVVVRVEERWPSDDPNETIEVDVIAVSMGGLVARAAADPPGARGRTGKRLNAARVFTLATPHRGAKLAETIRLDASARAMQPGSDWLADLDSRFDDRTYALIPYGQTNDRWVGATRTAPHGMQPYWTGGTLMFSHFDARNNPWFLADIARRLRGEEPISITPAKPPRD